MILSSPKSSLDKSVSISLPTSKSISNRLLIASALAGEIDQLKNLSEAKDTQLLLKALQSDQEVVDVGMAGTAYRFLTAFFALQSGLRILEGSPRMKERPIRTLVDLLKEMGAEIEYLEKDGFPPLKINGRPLSGGSYEIDGSISSQYISAVLLIAPYLKEELRIKLKGEIVSDPYIFMTLQLMKEWGAKVHRKETEIIVKPEAYQFQLTLKVEKDWSSAAFFYQFAAFGFNGIQLDGLIKESIQGDVQLVNLFRKLGVKTSFNEKGVNLSAVDFEKEAVFFDMVDCPDLIPSIAVTASQLIKECVISGISTLRIKESDRFMALKMELEKVGSKVELLDHNQMKVGKATSIPKKVSFEVHDDHRMAMCLAPLIAFIDQVEISQMEVVDKSFPNFWDELKKLGVSFN